MQKMTLVLKIFKKLLGDEIQCPMHFVMYIIYILTPLTPHNWKKLTPQTPPNFESGGYMSPLGPWWHCPCPGTIVFKLGIKINKNKKVLRNF